MRSITAKSGKDAAADFLVLLIIAVFFFPLIFEEKTLFFRDLTVLAYPMKYFTHKAYHEGFLPFWNPAVYSGMPFLSVLYTGVLYPLNLVFFLDNFTAAFNWFYILHYVLLTLSVYALIRYWGLSVGAALCSAVTALLSGFFLSLPGATSLFYSAVWLPSIFYWTQRCLRETKMSCFLGAVFCLACQTLGGSPEFCALTVLTLFFWSLARAPEAGWGRKTLRNGLAVAALALVSCGITAMQLVPTFVLTKDTMRSEGLDFDRHAKWSMHPADLVTLLNPKDYTGFMEAVPPPQLFLIQNFHMGLFAALFLGAALLYLRHRAIRFWLFTFLLGIFFALGKYNPLYQGIYEWFPLIKLFRYPEKFYFLAAFSQVFLVGHGVDALIKSASTREPKPAAYLWLILGIGVACVAFGKLSGNTGSSLVYLMVFGVFCALFFLQKWSAGGLKSILLVLIFLDLILRHYMLVPMIDKKFYEDLPTAAREINGDKGLSRIYVGKVEGPPDALPIPGSFLARQINLREILYPDFGAIHGMDYANGGRGWSLELQDQWLWTEIFYHSSSEKRLRILKRSNVKYWVEGEAETDDAPIHARVRKLDSILPRAFLVGKFRVGKAPHLLNTYYDELFDPLREVLLSEPASVDEVADFSGLVEDVQYGANKVVIKTRQSGAGFLVLLDSWFPGWTATVNGAPSHIFRANHFYRAVQLSSGAHTVEFSFEPVGFWLGLWISVATLVSMIALYLLQHVGNRRRLKTCTPGIPLSY